MLRIGFICPTYNAKELHQYTATALESFFDTTPGGVALVIDDASTTWSKGYEATLKAIADKYPNAELKCLHFPKSGGLTRSWNAGLSLAHDMGLDYAIAGNNDVIFTDKWHAGLLHAVNNGFDMAGPLSNAPGITAKGKQEINRYVDAYTLTDDRKQLDKIAQEIYTKHIGKVVEVSVNGFFQFASMESWRKGMFNELYYYRPVNTHTSKGRRNRTPLMTLNEDELQGRWHKKKMKSAIALGSFIFHYRAVSRGNKYKRGKWYRQQ